MPSLDTSTSPPSLSRLVAKSHNSFFPECVDWIIIFPPFSKLNCLFAKSKGKFKGKLVVDCKSGVVDANANECDRCWCRVRSRLLDPEGRRGRLYKMSFAGTRKHLNLLVQDYGVVRSDFLPDICV